MEFRKKAHFINCELIRSLNKNLGGMLSCWAESNVFIAQCVFPVFVKQQLILQKNWGIKMSKYYEVGMMIPPSRSLYVYSVR